MSERSVAPPARTTNPPPDKELLADAVEEALARLRTARPHLERRLDRAATIVVVHLSSAARTRPIKVRVRGRLSSETMESHRETATGRRGRRAA